MKKIYGILLLAATLMGLSACKWDESKGFYIGKSTSYPSFCGVHYDWLEDRLPEQTLELQMGELEFSNPIILQVVYKKDKDKEYKPAGKLLTITGENVVNDLITIYPKEQTKKLKFRFNKHGVQGVKSARYTLALRVENPGDLDQINGQQAKRGLILDSDLMWVVNYEEVMNPLLKGIIWFLILVAAGLLIWIFVIKPIRYPVFKMRRLELQDPEPYSASIMLRGYRQVVLTSKPKQQNFLSILFTGKIKYCVNSTVWTADVVIEPKDKRTIRIIPNKQEYYCDARWLKINEETVIENNTTHAKTKVKLS